MNILSVYMRISSLDVYQGVKEECMRPYGLYSSYECLLQKYYLMGNFMVYACAKQEDCNVFPKAK